MYYCLPATAMSAYKIPLHLAFEICKMRFYLPRCICTEFISKTRYQKTFCYIQQSEFRGVKQSRMYCDSIQDGKIDLFT